MNKRGVSDAPLPTDEGEEDYVKSEIAPYKRNAMRIVLTNDQAVSVSLADDLEFVRSCLYLGMGLIQIREIQRTPFNKHMKLSYIDSAYDMGMTDEDIVARK